MVALPPQRAVDSQGKQGGDRVAEHRGPRDDRIVDLQCIVEDAFHDPLQKDAAFGNADEHIAQQPDPGHIDGDGQLGAGKADEHAAIHAAHAKGGRYRKNG